MWLDKLKKDWDENPMVVLSVGILAVSTLVRVLDIVSAAQSRRAYAKQIDHKIRNSR